VFIFSFELILLERTVDLQIGIGDEMVNVVFLVVVDTFFEGLKVIEYIESGILLLLSQFNQIYLEYHCRMT
jgi:hypothetical protein